MNKKELLRNITIGLTDGLTIPFALAAGLSGVMESSLTVAAFCMALAAAGGITMGTGAYLEQRESAPTRQAGTAFIIGTSYISGGIISVLPYLFIPVPDQALTYSAAVSLAALFLAGYYESQVNDAHGFTGGVRVMLTGAIAATAAFYVAKLFI